MNEVANPRGLHLYKSNTSLPDDPPGLFLLQAWRDHSKILYYPNACERHGDTLEVWKDLKGTGCVHPYDINIVNERVYLLCQTSHNVYYYNLHDPDQDGVEEKFPQEDFRVFSEMRENILYDQNLDF